MCAHIFAWLTLFWGGWLPVVTDDVIEVLNIGSDEKEETPRKRKKSLDFEVESDERPTWIKVHTHYLSTETLYHYCLQWEYDSKDRNYLLTKGKYLARSSEFFQHTKRINGASLTQLEPTLIQMPGSNTDSDLDSQLYGRLELLTLK